MRAIPLLLALALTATGVGQADITVLCSNGMKAVVEELVPQFEQETKHHVAIRYGVSAVLKREIDGGEPFDLAILTPALIDDLIKQGTIARDSRVTLARSPMALAVRAGASKPGIRTADALTRVLRASTSISYAREGASSAFFMEVVQKLGLTEVLKPRITLTNTGAEAGAAVARGDAQLAVLPVSEILPIAGVEVLGIFPAEVQGYLVMVSGTNARSARQAAVKAFVAFITAPAAQPVLEKRGMEIIGTSPADSFATRRNAFAAS